jgi:hypothetical protein
LSLDFAVQHPCTLRARYKEQHLREWGKLGSVHARVTTGEQVVPSVETLNFVVQARGEIEQMESATSVCLRCPARLPTDAAGEGEAVGCLGRISYPVEAQFEKFLADRVQLALDTIAEAYHPRLLRIFVDADSPFDGEGTKDLRGITTLEGLRFYELRLPIRFAREAARLTTDNLFDMLAGFRSDVCAHTTYARELPSEAVADYFDLLDLLLRHDLSAAEQTRQRARSRNYAQFLRLLAALERAEALGARVLLD